MPHYFFNLTDGITQRDHSGLDCIDDAEAVQRATAIAKEVLAAGGDKHTRTCTFQLYSMGTKFRASRFPWTFAKPHHSRDADREELSSLNRKASERRR
jgi:hypothetical protein